MDKELDKERKQWEAEEKEKWLSSMSKEKRLLTEELLNIMKKNMEHCMIDGLVKSLEEQIDESDEEFNSPPNNNWNYE